MRIPDENSARGGAGLSRRRFMALTASAAGGAALGASETAATEPTLTMPPGVHRSRVALVQSQHVVDGSEVHRTLLGEMVAAALTAATKTDSEADAWRALLKPDDVIGLKFNRSGQAVIGTTPAVADILINSLVGSGWRSEQIVCIEGPPESPGRRSTTAPAVGWDKTETDFGSGSDQLASVLHQITALINISFVKTHNIAGMTCGLKNLSHGLVKHPARYHANGCSPYIADIVALESIRSKLKLSLVDGLRVVFDGGPRASEETISDDGMFLASTDPVAADAVAFTVLNQTRQRRGLPPIAGAPEDLGYLAAAHRRGLGIALAHGVQIVRVDRT